MIRLARPLAMSAATFALAAQNAPASLHAAWIREVLDADSRGAAAMYRMVAKEPAAPLLERRLAIARLVELRRLDIEAAAPLPHLELLPVMLRQSMQPQLRAGDRHPVIEQELELAAGDVEPMRAFLESTPVPQLRPWVYATAQATLEENDPQLAERTRLRTRFLPLNDSPAQVLDRIRATEIVRAELDGRPLDADRLRTRDFPNWRPQPWSTDAGASWTTVRDNLTQWLREVQLLPAEQDLLSRLKTRLDALSAERPEQALQLVDRLPLYAERLRMRR